jgi:ketopantoate reductase
MHIAIVGAGALGRTYGVRLSGVADVTFVVRPSQQSPAPIRIVRIDGDQREDTVDRPTLATSVPPEADVVVVCVRAEQIGVGLEGQLSGRDVPIVIMTPLMPDGYARLLSSLGPRVLAGMPGVVAYAIQSGVTRYWLPRVAPTLIDEPRPPVESVSELVRLLISCGLPARLELGVHEANPATTVAFVPMAMGLDAAGSIDALLSDRPLLDVTLAAVREGLELSKRIGKSAGWVTLLTSFVGPLTLRIGVSLGRRRSPEAIQYVEEHFGRKLHAQNVAMADAMIRLARERGTASDALTKLFDRLRGGAHASE